MKILYIGSVEFSGKALEHLLEIDANIVGICGANSSAINSDFFDLSPIALRANIPLRFFEDINSEDALNWIRERSPDIIFCFGWSRLLGEKLLRIPNMGVVGFHPTLLPANRGRHPIIWALVLGLEETGSTFFFMDSGADSGDILSQKKIPIYDSDNARTLYDRICSVALKQISEFMPFLISGTYQRIKQNSTVSNLWRKRSKKDGVIDWRMPAKAIYNLVRALSDPYPGALIIHQLNEIKVLDVEIISGNILNCEPGKVIAINSGKLVINCGIDSICLLSTDPILNAKVGECI
jgi:methionyl-tRNA formyltransferase